MSDGGNTPDVLHHVELAHVPRAECDSDYGGGKIDENMMCAKDPGQDSCQGDSGGKNVMTNSIVFFVS